MLLLLVAGFILYAAAAFAETTPISGDSQNTAPAIAARGQGSAQVASSLSSSARCANQQRCREIDEVWQHRIGFLIRGNDEVWDVSDSWRRLGVIYPAPGRAFSGLTGSGPCVAQVGTLEQKALLDTIAWAEGTANLGDNGYNVLVDGEFVSGPQERFRKENGHNFFIGYESYPNILINFKRQGQCISGITSPCSFAAGRYQFTRDIFTAAGFGPEEQDKAALRIVSDEGVSTQTITEAISNGNFVTIWDSLAGRWASLPKSTGESAYQHLGQRAKTSQQLQQQFKKCLEQHTQ